MQQSHITYMYATCMYCKGPCALENNGRKKTCGLRTNKGVCSKKVSLYELLHAVVIRMHSASGTGLSQAQGRSFARF